jgi:tripartite-type tricarboxylate transporter receptor subunit TctC
VVVDDRPGAGGIIGTAIAAKAPADGYTLGLGTITTLAINPALHATLPYDSVHDFVPVVLMASGSLVLVLNPSVPAHTVRELIALSKSRPAELTYGSIGNGSTQHITAELFKSLTGADLRHIPYKETGAAVGDLTAEYH